VLHISESQWATNDVASALDGVKYSSLHMVPSCSLSTICTGHHYSRIIKASSYHLLSFHHRSFELLFLHPRDPCACFSLRRGHAFEPPALRFTTPLQTRKRKAEGVSVTKDTSNKKVKSEPVEPVTPASPLPTTPGTLGSPQPESPEPVMDSDDDFDAMSVRSSDGEDIYVEDVDTDGGKT